MPLNLTRASLSDVKQGHEVGEFVETVIQLNNNEITKPKVLIVEGKDDYYFIESILKNMGLLEQFNIFQTGGITKLNEKLAVLSKDKMFPTVERIGVIFDADDDATNALKRIKESLTSIGLQPPSQIDHVHKYANKKVGVYLFKKPGEQNGILEDLFLALHYDSPITAHVEEYFSNLEAILPKHQSGKKIPKASPLEYKFPKNASKGKARALTAGFHEDLSSIGHAAQHKYLDFDSIHLDSIKDFINDLNL